MLFLKTKFNFCIYQKNNLKKENFKDCFLFFSNLLGIQKHFCLIKVNDGSKDYTPESKTIIDLPTLSAFFGKLDATKGIVGEYVRGICDRWNKKYLDKPQVGYYFALES